MSPPSSQERVRSLTEMAAAVKPAKGFLYQEDHHLAALCAANNRIFGSLARGVPLEVDTSMYDLPTLKGKYGESAIGSLLNILALETSDLFIFHGVANPKGASRGETDHVMLYRDKLILLETKTYRGYDSVKVSKEGDLRGRRPDKPGSLRKLDNNNLIQKVRTYEHQYPMLSVHAITALTRADVKTASENGKYKVASLTNLLMNVEYHIEQAKQVEQQVTKQVVWELASRCLG